MTIERTSFEIQIRDTRDRGDGGSEEYWLTIDFVEPVEAVRIPERRALLEKVSQKYVRDARLVRVETHVAELDTVPFKKETS
jgi:hypothetical protein